MLVNGVSRTVTYPGYAEAETATLTAFAGLATPHMLARRRATTRASPITMPKLDLSQGRGLPRTTSTASIPTRLFGGSPPRSTPSPRGATSSAPDPLSRPEMQADGLGTMLIDRHPDGRRRGDSGLPANDAHQLGGLIQRRTQAWSASTTPPSCSKKDPRVEQYSLLIRTGHAWTRTRTPTPCSRRPGSRYEQHAACDHPDQLGDGVDRREADAPGRHHDEFRGQSDGLRRCETRRPAGRF